MKNFNVSVIFVSIIAFVVYFAFCPDSKIYNFNDSVLRLGDSRYDMADIQAPVATGIWLEFLSYLLSYSRLGPRLRRHLLDENNVANIRQLASQIELPPLQYPIYRVTDEEWDLARILASNESEHSLSIYLQHALIDVADSDASNLATVRDYARKYHRGDLKVLCCSHYML